MVLVDVIDPKRQETHPRIKTMNNNVFLNQWDNLSVKVAGASGKGMHNKNGNHCIHLVRTKCLCVGSMASLE